MTTPTTTTPSITSTEVAPFRIASALLTFAASVIADLGTLFGLLGASGAYEARAVVTSLPANTGTGTGTLSGSVNGAFGTQDGISTLAVGDVVVIQGGTANLAAPKDSGYWQIQSLGGAGSKWSLIRPSWWATGSVVPISARVETGGEGTFFANTAWKATCAKGTVIDTTDPLIYCGNISFTGVLVAGVLSLPAGTLKVGILSATRSLVSATCSATGGTVTTTVGYGPKASPTPGYLGTAAVTLYALTAGQGTNTTDTSTILVNVDNGF